MLKDIGDRASWMGGATIVAVALFAIWGLRHTAGYSWGFDESTILLTGREIARGVQLYDPMWWNYPPLFLWQVGAVMRLSGESIIAARGLAVSWSILYVLATAALASRIGGGAAALSSTFLILLFPHFVEFSRAVMADIATATLATLALVVALRPDSENRHSRLLGDAAVGVFCALAAFSKQTMVLLLPALLAALLIGPTQHKRLTRLGVALGSGLIVSALIFSQTPPGPFLEQVVNFHIGIPPTSLDPVLNARKIWHFFSAPQTSWSSPLVLVGPLGISQAWVHRRERPAGLVTALALAVMLPFFLLYQPLYEHHLLLLTPAWTALSGVGLAWLAGGRDAWRGRWRTRTWLLALALGAITFIWYQPWRTYTEFAAPRVEARARLGPPLAAAWRTSLPPGTRIVSDDPMLILLSGHQAVPELVNLSYARLQRGNSGGLETILPHLESAPPDVIAIWTSRLRDLPGFLEWVQPRYRVVAAHGDGDRRIYCRWQSPTHNQTATLDDSLLLRGYDLAPSHPLAGGVLTVTVTYQIVQPPPEDTLITASIEQDGRIFVRSEQGVGTAEIRPKLLLPGDRIVRTFHLALADSLPAGVYRVRLGIRRPTIPEEPSVDLAQPVYISNISGTPSLMATRREAGKDATFCCQPPPQE